MHSENNMVSRRLFINPYQPRPFAYDRTSHEDSEVLNWWWSEEDEYSNLITLESYGGLYVFINHKYSSQTLILLANMLRPSHMTDENRWLRP